MKFGKRIRFMTVFVWAENYIDYKTLKSCIRAIKEGKKEEQEFIDKFKAEAARVHTFFGNKLDDTVHRLASLLQRTEDYIHSGVYNIFGIDSLHRALATVDQRLTDLQDFREVNHEGFRKAVKKFQKHIQPRNQRHTQTYLMTVMLPNMAPKLCHPEKLGTAISSLRKAFQQLESTRELLLQEIASSQPRILGRDSFSSAERNSLQGYLADLGTPSTAVWHSLSNRLRTAVRLADADRVAYILRTSLSDADLTTVIALGGPLLHLTTAAGDIPSSKLLLKLGVDVNVRDVVDRTCLQNTLRTGQRDVAEFLLQQRADLNTVSLNRHTLLHSSVVKGNPECVRLLLQYRARSAPPIALTGQLEEDTRNLLAGGGMLTALLARDGGGYNSVYLAASRNHPKCLSIMLQAAVFAFRYSAQPSAVQLSVPREASTGSLSVDSKELRVEEVHGLLSRRIGANVQWTALHGAAQAGSHRCVRILLEVVRLLSFSSEKNALHGLPPQRSRTINYPRLTSPSANAGIEMDFVNCRVGATSSTALHEAAQRGFMRTAAWLLKAGACTTIGNAYGESPLHMAARSGHASTLSLMLRYTPGWALAAIPPERIAVPLESVGSSKQRRFFSPIPEGNADVYREESSNQFNMRKERNETIHCNISAFFINPNSWVPLLHEAIDSSSTAGARTSAYRQFTRDAKDDTASSSGSASLRCVLALLKAGANPVEDDDEGWSALALALYIGNGQVAQLCRDYSSYVLSSRCSKTSCSPPTDWRKRGGYISKEAAEELGAGSEPAQAVQDADNDSEDAHDVVEEGHETLDEGEWELRVTLGGIPSVKGTVSVPAVSLLPWALPEETASLVQAGHQNSQGEEADAQMRTANTSLHKKNKHLHGRTHRLARLEEQEYATTKRVRLNIRKISMAGPSGSGTSTNRVGSDQTGVDEGWHLTDDADIEEQRLNLPLYYRKHPGPSAQPLNMNPFSSSENENSRTEEVIRKTRTERIAHQEQAEKDIGRLTSDDGLSHQQSLKPKQDKQDTIDEEDSSDSESASDSEQVSEASGEEQEDDAPSAVERGASWQKSVYAESVGSTGTSGGSVFDAELDDLGETEGNGVMCVGADGQMVNTKGMALTDDLSDSAGKEAVSTTQRAKEISKKTSPAKRKGETIGIWETARPGELSSLAADPEADAEIVFHARSPFEFNLNVDLSAAGTGADSVAGKSLCPASLLTRCNPTSYTFHFHDAANQHGVSLPPRAVPEYGATAGHEQDGYGIHQWGENMAIRMSGQIALPILSSNAYSGNDHAASAFGTAHHAYSSMHPPFDVDEDDSRWVSRMVAAVSRGSGSGPFFNHLGILTLRYMLIRPYKPPVPRPVSTPSHTETHIGAKKEAVRGLKPYWKSVRQVRDTGEDKLHRSRNAKLAMVPFVGGPTKVFGHRGSGADTASRLIGEEIGARVRRTHVAENTLLSFVTAANLGAEYIEFDVQLSKDLVPIIHHDWEIKLPYAQEITVPITHLTAAQLQQLRPQVLPQDREEKEREKRQAVKPPRSQRSSSRNAHGDGSSASPALAGISSAQGDTPPPFMANSEQDGFPGLSSTAPPDKNSRSLWRSNDDSTIRESTAPRRALEALGLDRTGAAQHREMSSKYFYGLQDSLTTLERVFQAVPTRTGFNIEVKYPNPQQALEHGLRPVDKNTYVERILDCVFTSSVAERKVMFSSFDPDICLLLSKKQGIYPVFLLTAAGTYLYADPRKNSLRAAVRFAVSNGLLGIVSDSTPLVEAPRLMTEVRNAGLVLCTYGARNNEVNCVKVQVANGVAAVIVDHVAHVTRSLREESEGKAASGNERNRGSDSDAPGSVASATF
eukprot:gb/GECG01014588.1/.p1 GENE.gb/GECG01014588.1/~~gb/GECG01014588.1/.p1  ORF type:complete len:1842 (+),score=248.99 gb/GECG01014588.1/:1-5526(+)